MTVVVQLNPFRLPLRNSAITEAKIIRALVSKGSEEKKPIKSLNAGGLKMGALGKWGMIAGVIGVVGVVRALSKQLGLGWNNDAALEWLRNTSDLLGIWAMPAYVGMHTLTLALCLPYAVFLEAGASLLFGFLPAVLCVFSAKVLGASLSFWIGRLICRSSSTAVEWIEKNKYFNVLSHGVKRDGWRFVLLARFPPIPSYVINYALAATDVRFAADFLFPTVIGCLPMILQNTSIGSLAGAAVASASGSKISWVRSYFFPVIGILSSIIISLRINKYYKDTVAQEAWSDGDVNDQNKPSVQSARRRNKSTKES